MKDINQQELEFISRDLERLKRAELQAVQGDLESLWLRFWREHQSFYLLLSFKKEPAIILLLDSKEEFLSFKPKKAEKKPLMLFFKSHFVNQKFQRVEVLKKYGRVLNIEFSNGASIELRFFRGASNIILKREGKKISLKKVQALKEQSSGNPLEDRLPSSLSLRSPQVLKEEFINLKKGREDKRQRPQKEQDAEKLDKALEKIKKALQLLKQDSFLKLAQMLEKGKQEELSPELQELYKKNLSLRENIERAYTRHKESDLKRERLLQRLKELELKKIDLEKKSPDSSSLKKAASKKTSQEKLQSTHYHLRPGLEFICGKTAKQNKELLKRARPWHFWMHLRDYPSGHLIMVFNKGFKITEKDLEKAAQFLFYKGAPKKLFASKDLKFEVICTEAKHVRSIKGAQVGKVRVERFKSYVFEWSESMRHQFL